MDYAQLEPRSVFHWFGELNKIPRGSGNEKAVSDYLVSWAKERNFEVEQDKALNVIIRKPATAGYENAPGVIIQGHMDMVCEKTADSDHDFLKDPIEMIVEGDFLRANNTTLGGDDGIAVAFGMAILDDSELAHPALELLVTTEEETGMGGAMAITEGQLQGKRLLNIDSEEEGIFLVSCAGGANIQVDFPALLAESSEPVPGLQVKIHGLRGGHSGMQIKLGRANALKIMSRLMQSVKNTSPGFRLSHVNGGSKHNAIPSAAEFSCTAIELDLARAALVKAAEEISAEFATVDPDLRISIDQVELKELMSFENSARVADFLFLAPNGVMSMSADIKGLVQTSLNIAILERMDDRLRLTTSVRSASMSARKAVLDKLQLLALVLGAKSQIKSSYPAWEFKQDSPLREKALSVYKEISGKDAEYTAIHAGLECGLLGEVMPGVDMISFGPDIFDVHTPKEHLSISSVQRVYEFTRALVEALKD